MSYHPANFGGLRHSGSEDNGFGLSRDIARPRDQTVA